MNQYVTGAMIKRLREARNMTQHQLAARMQISDKAVSKWETGRGYPDISLIEPLSAALGVSVIELLSGENVINTNRSANMLRKQDHRLLGQRSLYDGLMRGVRFVVMRMNSAYTKCILHNLFIIFVLFDPPCMADVI